MEENQQEQNSDEKKIFYEFALSYVENQLSEYYKKHHIYPEDIAKETAIKHIQTLITPEQWCDIHNPHITLNHIFLRLITSCQNYYNMPNIIKFKQLKDKFAQVLEDFDYNKILQRYASSEHLYKTLAQHFDFPLSDDPHHTWREFSRSVMSSAKFMAKFESVADFRNLFESIATRFPTSQILPQLIRSEIYGLGETLSHDFIKELGYAEYAKPDITSKQLIHQIFENRDDKLEDPNITQKLCKIAYSANTTVYTVEKVLYLIATGKYTAPNKDAPKILIKGTKLRETFIKAWKAHKKSTLSSL